MMIHYLNWIRTGSVDCSDHLGWIKTGSGGYGDLGIRKKKTNIAASSDGGPKPMQTPPRWHQESGAQRAHAFTVAL